MTTKKAARLFLCLLLSMIAYILWSFYISEPKYINNSNGKKLEKYDLVSISDRYYHSMFDESGNQDVITAIVLQTDDKFALLKLTETNFMRSEFKQVPVNSNAYRVIGRGTIYHKLNNFVGFNIMMVTQVLIIIILILLFITKLELLKHLL